MLPNVRDWPNWNDIQNAALYETFKTYTQQDCRIYNDWQSTVLKEIKKQDK